MVHRNGFYDIGPRVVAKITDMIIAAQPTSSEKGHEEATISEQECGKNQEEDRELKHANERQAVLKKVCQVFSHRSPVS
jgi:hypothetical protein